jgi:hypothetical protein
MTTEEAFDLHRKWFGTAETRKPPTDNDLRRYLVVTREVWDEAERLVAEEREKRRKAFEGKVQIFVCGRGQR